MQLSELAKAPIGERNLYYILMNMVGYSNLVINGDHPWIARDVIRAYSIGLQEFEELPKQHWIRREFGELELRIALPRIIKYYYAFIAPRDAAEYKHIK